MGLSCSSNPQVNSSLAQPKAAIEHSINPLDVQMECENKINPIAMNDETLIDENGQKVIPTVPTSDKKESQPIESELKNYDESNENTRMNDKRINIYDAATELLHISIQIVLIKRKQGQAMDRSHKYDENNNFPLVEVAINDWHELQEKLAPLQSHARALKEIVGDQAAYEIGKNAINAVYGSEYNN